MYEGDAPLAERRAAALALDRDLLRDLLGAEELRELIDPGVLADLELELQRLADGRRARDPDELTDVLRGLGPLTREEADARSDGPGIEWLDDLVAATRVIRGSVAGEERFAAAEDASRVRDALGVALPPGLPQAFTDPVERPLVDLVARYARTHGPFLVQHVARRLGVRAEPAQLALEALEHEGRIVRGEFRPDGVEREWCDEDVLRTLRRRSLAVLRQEVEPVDGSALARFLPAWQGVGVPRRGPEGLVEVLNALQGAALPASIVESDVLPARMAAYRPSDLDALCTAGEVVWVGAGALGATDGRVRLVYRDRLGLLVPAAEEPPEGPVHAALLAHLDAAGRLVLARPRRRLGRGGRALRRAHGAGRRCGTWSGRVSSPTTRWPPSARSWPAGPAARPSAARRPVASPGSVRPRLRGGGRWSTRCAGPCRPRPRRPTPGPGSCWSATAS